MTQPLVIRPTPQQLAAAYGKHVPDLIAPNLRILFVGINPGLYSAAIRHHFGRPGNRFWPALFNGGLTPRLIHPHEEKELIGLGYGITNVINRATATAEELRREEYVAGANALEEKVKKYRPKVVAFLGIGAYRTAYAKPAATLGRQAQDLGGAAVWVLPNPSGLNAHYTAAGLAKLFRELNEAVG